MIYFNSITEKIYKRILINVINHILLGKSTINTFCCFQPSPGIFSFYETNFVIFPEVIFFIALT